MEFTSAANLGLQGTPSSALDVEEAAQSTSALEGEVNELAQELVDNHSGALLHGWYTHRQRNKDCKKRL